MRYISHRGNLRGRDHHRENHLDYIVEAMDAGFDVEIDVWKIGEKLFLGHDGPQEQVETSFLLDHRLWVHAKNYAAMDHLLDHPLCVFWHEKDAYTLTSWGDIWAYPGSKLTSKSVAVMPETLVVGFEMKDEDILAHVVKSNIGPAWAVCSDYVDVLRKYWEKPVAE